MIPHSLIQLSKAPVDRDELENVKTLYNKYKDVLPSSQDERRRLGQVLNLNRAQYKAVTGLSDFQSISGEEFKVDNLTNPEWLEAQRKNFNNGLEGMLHYPSISIALYVATAITLLDRGETSTTLDVEQYTDYIKKKGASLDYRIYTGLLLSNNEETNSIFLNTAKEILGKGNFSKRFFLQGKVFFPQLEEEEETSSSVEKEEVETSDLTLPISKLFLTSEVTSRYEIETAWQKLKRSKIYSLKNLCNHIRDSFTDREKLSLINLVNQTRPVFKEITGLTTTISSPLFSVLKRPVERISREEHIALRQTLLEEGGLTALYLLYPSLSVAVQAEAALRTGWPEGGQELAQRFKDFTDNDSSPQRLTVRLLKQTKDEPNDPIYSAIRSIVPPGSKRHVYQGAVLFCRIEATSMYDINNVVCLRSPCISSWGAELPENESIRAKFKYQL